MSRYSLLGVVSSNEAVTALAPASASSRLCARYSTCGVFTRSGLRNSWNGCPAAAAALWSMYWSRPGHRLTTSRSFATASPTEVSVS